MTHAARSYALPWTVIFADVFNGRTAANTPAPSKYQKEFLEAKTDAWSSSICVFRQQVLNPSKNGSPRHRISSLVRSLSTRQLLSSTSSGLFVRTCRTSLSSETSCKNSCRQLSSKMPQLVLSHCCLVGREVRNQTSLSHSKRSGSHAAVPLITRGAKQRNRRLREPQHNGCQPIWQ